MSTASTIISNTGTDTAAGSTTGSIAGAAIGAATGLITGIYSSYENAQTQKEKEKILKEAAAKYNTSVEAIKAEIEAYYNNPSNTLGTSSDVTNYENAIENYNPEDYVYNYSPFSYDKTVEDFEDKDKQQVLDATAATTQNTAAGARNWSFYRCS